MISNFNGNKPVQNSNNPVNNQPVGPKTLQRADYETNLGIISRDKMLSYMGAPPRFNFTFMGKTYGMSKEYSAVMKGLDNFHANYAKLNDKPVSQSGALLSDLISNLEDALKAANDYRSKHANDPAKKHRCGVMEDVGKNCEKELAQLRGIEKHAENFDASLTAGGVLKCLKHGIDHPSLLSNAHTKDQMMGDPVPLGKGALNSVSLVTYRKPNGEIEQKVLKPLSNTKGEGLGRDSAIGIPLNNLQSAQRNIASSLVAGLLGQQDMIPKPEVVIHGDTVCLEMNLAKGEDVLGERMIPCSDELNRTFRQWEADGDSLALEFTKATKIGTDDNGLAVYGQPQEVVRDLPITSEEPNSLTASLQKGLLDLQVIDLICGQVDRHQHNYFVRIEGGEAKITGIDNDTSFGTSTTSTYNFGNGTKDKVTVPWPGLPPLMSFDMFKNLMSITEGKLTETLQRSGLNDDAISVAVTRLNVVKAHAVELEVTGRVVENFEEWTFTDEESGTTMTATEYLMSVPNDSYVRQYAELRNGQIEKDLPLLQIDASKHDLGND